MPTVRSLWSFDGEDLTDSGPAGNSSPTTETNLDYVTGFVGGGSGMALTDAGSGGGLVEIEPLTTPFPSGQAIAFWLYIPASSAVVILIRLMASGPSVILECALDMTAADPVDQLVVSNGEGSLACGDLLVQDDWNFVAIWCAGGQMYTCVNDPEAVGSIYSGPIEVSEPCVDMSLSPYFAGVAFDEVTVFTGSLATEDLIWLYNAGAGRTATEILAHTFSPDVEPTPTPVSRTVTVAAESRIITVSA